MKILHSCGNFSLFFELYFQITEHQFCYFRIVVNAFLFLLASLCALGRWPYTKYFIVIKKNNWVVNFIDLNARHYFSYILHLFAGVACCALALIWKKQCLKNAQLCTVRRDKENAENENKWSWIRFSSDIFTCAYCCRRTNHTRVSRVCRVPEGLTDCGWHCPWRHFLSGDYRLDFPSLQASSSKAAPSFR